MKEVGRQEAKNRERKSRDDRSDKIMAITHDAKTYRILAILARNSSSEFTVDKSICSDS